MNNTLAGINRITEEEGQINYLEEWNGGIHCHRTEHREKNEKKKKRQPETSATLNTPTFAL